MGKHSAHTIDERIRTKKSRRSQNKTSLGNRLKAKVENSVPSSDFRYLRTSLGLTQEEIGQLAGISTRKISALETGEKAPTPDDRRKFQELLRLQTELVTIMKSEVLADWLRSPNDYFDGFTPMQIVMRGESDRIWRLVWRLRDGVPLT